MPEVEVRCPDCGRFLAALAPEDTGVRVACHGLSIRVDRRIDPDSGTPAALAPVPSAPPAFAMRGTVPPRVPLT